MKELADFEAIALARDIQPLCPNCGEPLRRKIQTPLSESLGGRYHFESGYRLWCESCSFDHFIEFATLPQLSNVNEINTHYDKLKEKLSIEFEEERQQALAQYRKLLERLEKGREVILKAATENNGKGAGCRLTYQDNVLYCVRYDNFLDNLRTAKDALEMLLGFEVEADQLTVEQYRSVG